MASWRGSSQPQRCCVGCSCAQALTDAAKSVVEPAAKDATKTGAATGAAATGAAPAAAASTLVAASPSKHAYQSIWDTSGNSSLEPAKALRFMPFKDELDASKAYLVPLADRIGPPPEDRTWRDEWVAARTEWSRIVHRGEYDEGYDSLEARKRALAGAIERRIATGWPAEEAEACTLAVSLADALGRALEIPGAPLSGTCSRELAGRDDGAAARSSAARNGVASHAAKAAIARAAGF